MKMTLGSAAESLKLLMARGTVRKFPFPDASTISCLVFGCADAATAKNKTARNIVRDRFNFSRGFYLILEFAAPPSERGLRPPCNFPVLRAACGRRCIRYTARDLLPQTRFPCPPCSLP